MNVKARFYCESVSRHGMPAPQSFEGEQYSERIVLRAIHAFGPDDPNRSYSEATPMATVELTITNKAAWGAFKAGHTYDAVFSPAVAAP
jgi:hypothetical protein